LTGSELITKSKIRERIFDTLNVTYTDGELLSYVNDGISMVWPVLAAAGYYEVVGDKTFTTASESLPTDFQKFVAQYPIMLAANGTATIYGSVPQVTRYIKRPPQLAAVGDSLPFTNDAINNIIGKIVIMLALNRNEYEVGFEKGIIDELRQSIG